MVSLIIHSAYTEENKHCVSLKEHEEIGGDSGGPLVVYENNEADGFTRVSAYLDYISHETGIQIKD